MNLLNLEKLDEERQKLATGTYRKGYKVCKGLTIPESFQYIQKDIEDFEVYDDDIWITTFPKCGTTWTQEMVWCICHDLDYETAKQETDIRMPFLEFCCMIYRPEPFIDEYDPGYIHNSIELARNAKRPRIIKTHLPFCLLPKQIQNFTRRPKIVHVYRNMKDTCVSFYHHHRLTQGFRGDFQLFWKLFITGKLFWTPMLDNILSYWQHRTEPNFLFLRFEDMKRDLRSVVLDVCKFFNKSFKREQIDELLQHLSFDSMQNNKFVNKSTTIEYCKKLGTCINQNGKFIRSGKTGGYKSEMDDEVEKIFDDYAIEKLKGTDLTFY